MFYKRAVVYIPGPVAIEACPSFLDGCSAPLCPLADNLADCLWYADEPICQSQKFKPLWARVQRRIAARSKDTGYFTVRMLESIKAVHPSIRGIDPDERGTVDNWLKAREGIKP